MRPLCDRYKDTEPPNVSGSGNSMSLWHKVTDIKILNLPIYQEVRLAYFCEMIIVINLIKFLIMTVQASTSMKRAGADLILTYFVKEVALLLAYK